MDPARFWALHVITQSSREVSEVIVSSSYGRGDRGAEGLSGQHSHHLLLLRLQSSRDCVHVAVGRAGICHVLVKR